MYEFIKGQGWVPTDPTRRLVQMACGRQVYIELRPPTLGELYNDCGCSNYDLNRWEISLKTTYFKWLIKAQEGPYEGNGFCVVTPV